jgi:ADP-ribose pyrophosphatase
MERHRETLLTTRRFAVVEETVHRPDRETAKLSYVTHPGSVAVLPLLDGDRICLINSRRLTIDKTLIEIPAGTREPGEPPLETARRELAEETGYRAGLMEELCVFYPSPGIMDEQMWIYVARDLTPGDHAREPNEEIENLVISWDDALALIDRGELEDGKALIAILAWERKRQRGE